MPRPSRNASARGIAPELLLSQVRNTAPYLLDDLSGAPALSASPPVAIVRALDGELPESLSHFEYFRLCLCAHYVTCATPVPTDVDNQIRRKLWAPGMPLVTALEMSQLVLESHGWDFTPLTNRASYGAAGSEWAHEPLSGHRGEWFTVASAAYAALGHYKAHDAKQRRQALLDAIAQETERHSEIFGSLWRAKDGIGALKASASIAHNFGDLDRVIDMWDVPVADPLRLEFHKLTTSAFGPEKNLRYAGRLWTAGELYKSTIDGSSMALENHRHFALRKPRALRSRPELRIPLGPFFDDWGSVVAATLSGEGLQETIDALVSGWERMPSTLAYARALHAIRAAQPDLFDRTAKLPRDRRLRAIFATPRADFEARWDAAALEHLDDIPSRA
ncbi:MAG: hypothetical protein M3Y87_25265 [Myxococcota bacterium]|nr:hypothetical protein [Myxococcota bacterium]